MLGRNTAPCKGKSVKINHFVKPNEQSQARLELCHGEKWSDLFQGNISHNLLLIYLCFNAFALSGRMLRVRYTQGAASLCPGLIAGCPVRALPTGPQYRRLPLKAKCKGVMIKGIYHITTTLVGPERLCFLRTYMVQRYTIFACATQNHPIISRNSLIFNLRYMMANKSDEVRKRRKRTIFWVS